MIWIYGFRENKRIYANICIYHNGIFFFLLYLKETDLYGFGNITANADIRNAYKHISGMNHMIRNQMANFSLHCLHCCLHCLHCLQCFHRSHRFYHSKCFTSLKYCYVDIYCLGRLEGYRNGLMSFWANVRWLGDGLVTNGLEWIHLLDCYDY